MNDSTHADIPTSARWVLTDRNLGVLRIGNREFSGQSLRRMVDSPGRRLLMPAIKEALDTGAAFRREVVFAGETWTVQAEPLRAPHSGWIVGVLAIIARAGARMVPRPPIGVMEWEGRISSVPPELPLPGYVRRDWWDRGMWEVHGMKPPAEIGPETLAEYTAARWLMEVVAPEHRVPLRMEFSRRLLKPDDRIHTVTIRVAHRFGTPDETVRDFRLAAYFGRNGEPGEGWIRAIMHQAADGCSDRPDLEDARLGDFLRAIFDLTADAAVVILEIGSLTASTISPGWAEMGLPPVVTGYFPNLLPLEDQAPFREAITRATAQPGSVIDGGLMRVRISDIEHRWFRFAFTAVRHVPNAAPMFVMCRLVPTSERGVDTEFVDADLPGERA